MYYDFQKNNKQLKLFSTFIIRTTIIKNEVPIIIDNSWAAIQHIRMISEGSRDTEDWSML